MLCELSEYWTLINDKLMNQVVGYHLVKSCSGVNWLQMLFQIQLVAGSQSNTLHAKKQKKSDKRIFLNADAVAAASATDAQGKPSVEVSFWPMDRTEADVG